MVSDGRTVCFSVVSMPAMMALVPFRSWMGWSCRRGCTTSRCRWAMQDVRREITAAEEVAAVGAGDARDGEAEARLRDGREARAVERIENAAAEERAGDDAAAAFAEAARG